MAEAVESKRLRWLSRDVIYLVLLIFIVSYLAYGLFYATAIYSDDWNHVIERPVTKNAKWLDPTDRRPLLFTPFLFQHRLLGVNVTAYYLVLWCLHLVLAFLIYMIAHRFAVLRQYSLSAIVALLFLVYPTIYSHMWLTTLSAYATLGLTLLYAYFLLEYVDGGRAFALLAALVFLLASFGIYEAQLGVVCAWPLILLLTHRQLSTSRRLGLLTPILIAAIFILWRTLGQQTIGVADTYLSQVSVTPGVLLSRVRLGYMISLFWGWATTIRWFLPWLPANKYAVLLLAIVVLALWWALSQITYLLRTRKGEATAWPLVQRWPFIRSYVGSGLVGLFLIGAGYVPVATVVLPNLSGNGASSRVNFFASLGGALFLACALMVGVLLFAKTRQQVKYLLLASVFPFLLLGIVTQASVQYENRTAWREQQAVWQGLFSAAPNFKDDTLVLLILPGFQDRRGYQDWRRTPLHAFWDVSSGVRILYDNPTLSGDIIFPDLMVEVEPTLMTQGIANQESGSITPYGQSVAFVYDNDSKTVHQLDELPVELIEGAANPVKLCRDCVLEESFDVPLRRLVQD